MQAIILAAGMGKRLKELTQDNTKCMVKVNGVRLIERMLNQLCKLKLKRTILVIGYEGDKLKRYVGSIWKGMRIEYIRNEIYDKTNNIYSLALAVDELVRDDTLLLESDIILEDSIFKKVLKDPHPNVAVVDSFQPWMDGTCVTIDEQHLIRRFVPKRDFRYEELNQYYKTVNIHKFSKEFSRNEYVPFLSAYSHALGDNEYYEQVLRVIAFLDKPLMYALPLSGEKWYEIDDVQDLDIAESMFCPASIRVQKLSSRYGGYWRYPNLKDYCYLVNPYYPPERMRAELKNSFDVLLENYPSGQGVNALLAAKMFGLHVDQIVVGNGAAEIIQAWMRTTSGKVGFIYPTFEEYPNRIAENRRVIFQPAAKNGFRYQVGDLIKFFDKNKIGALVLVNPDNPSGNFLSQEEMNILISWTKKHGIRLLIDESFIDFAAQPYTLLDRSVLTRNPHLFVVKSISKSYGVPGLRLGVMASGATEYIRAIREKLSIWNINSFGEFFLQIVGKYEKEYHLGCRKIVAERNRFISKLARVGYLQVFPSEANYVLCKVLPPYMSKRLTLSLLQRAECLIKDCAHKKGFGGMNFVRIAVKSSEDNDSLLQALMKL